MPAAYSLDLREKAIAAYERGERKIDVCRTLDISRNTLDQWLKLRRETGIVAPKTYRRGPKPKISDLDKFQQFVQEHGNLTQEEMAQKWSEQSVSVTQPLIGQALRKIEYTRKKKVTSTKNGMRKSEQHSKKK